MVRAEVFLLFFVAAILGVPAKDLNPKPVLLPHPSQVPKSQGLNLESLWTRIKNIRTSVKFNPDTDNVYYLFTRAHPSLGLPLLLGNDQLLAQADFEPGRRTVILVHGWLGSVVGTLNLVLVPAFLAAEDVNVVVVDWGVGAAGIYDIAVTNTVTSGEGVARFINWLNRATGASLADYHIVGHSLGGHQAGVIGRNLDGLVPYITALDPAEPLWITNPNRLRPDDSQYTEVIHTNVGVSGYLFPLGHVDFYPNGGIDMPGCDGQSCDHDRCFWYMAESVTYGGFTGTECNSLLSALLKNCNSSGRLNMGGTKPKTGRIKIKRARGLYHLRTNAQSPFSIY